MPDRKYSEERLEKSKFLFLEPKIEMGISFALKRLDEGDTIEFLNGMASIDYKIEHHVMNNCAKAESEDIRIKCITDVRNMKIRAINRLGEALYDKCGGTLAYLEEDK